MAAGNEEEVEKLSRRVVRMEPGQAEDCRQMLTFLGVPWVNAPCEAEAECAALAKSGKAWATATEDMDALAHGTPVLLRHLGFAGDRENCVEITQAIVLRELGLTQEECIFIQPRLPRLGAGITQTKIDCCIISASKSVMSRAAGRPSAAADKRS
jgi:5'-3' exonuclease